MRTLNLKDKVDVTKASKVINAPLRFVFNCCTDFRETDPEYTGSKSRRIILNKTKKQTIYAALYPGADGKEKVAVNIVTMKPPTSWHLESFGEEDYETGEYRLKSLGKNKTRLDMVFKEKWRDISPIPSIQEQLDGTNRVWDKYVQALEKEYNESA
jgi:hypothetical protein